jgi:hypothetical protein
MTESKTKKISRRDAIKLLGATAGATVLANLPTQWSKPELTAGLLPAHAQTSTVQNVGCTGLGLTITLSLFLGDVDLRVTTPDGFFVTPKPTGLNQGLVDPFTGATHSGEGLTETITVPVGNLTNGLWLVSINIGSGNTTTPYLLSVSGACATSNGSGVLDQQNFIHTYAIQVLNCQVVACLSTVN